MKENKAVKFESLDDKDKDRVMMYITARQFKNAVPIEEMIILPSDISNLNEDYNIKINNLDYSDFITKCEIKDNSKIELNDIALVTVRGNRIINKNCPFIVNKAFACEVYLKIILLENSINFKDLKGKNGHNLFELYDKTNLDFKEYFINKISTNFTNIEYKIKNISESFINWRYIYEKYKTIGSLDFLFLNEFCDILDEYVAHIIYENYNYDVSKDTR